MIYSVSIRHRLDSALFNPTIWADRVQANSAAEARTIAAQLYNEGKKTVFNDPSLNALVAAQPDLSECEIIARKIKNQ